MAQYLKVGDTVKIPKIIKHFVNIKNVVLNSLYYLVNNPSFNRTRCKKIQISPFFKNVTKTPFFIVLSIVIFYFTPVSSKLATFIENKIQNSTYIEIEQYWEPEPPQPIHEIEYVFPEISRSFMLLLAQNYYLGQKNTTIENVDLFSEHILLELERRNQTGELFQLPLDFKVKEAAAIQEFYSTENINEYDGQIFDAWQDALETNSILSFHRLGITALDALNLLKRTGNVNQDEYIYYSELAFYGFGNEYILNRPTEGARADWFYRIAQVYDYLGWAANDQDPPLQHEMYFISAGFLNLSFDTLSSMNFNEDKCEIYRHDIWELHIVMLYRLGIYFDQNESFFNRLRDHCEIINDIGLTPQQQNIIQGITDKVDEWERISNTKTQ